MCYLQYDGGPWEFVGQKIGLSESTNFTISEFVVESNTASGTKLFWTDICDALNKHGKESEQNLEQHQVRFLLS